MTNEWISVKDRLPDMGVSILIFDQGTIAVSHYSGYGEAWPNEKGTREERSFHRFSDYQDEQPGYHSPTHWMPLPEPPVNIN